MALFPHSVFCGCPGAVSDSDNGPVEGIYAREFENRTLNGYIDEVAVYKRALTAEEVKELYRGGKP